MAEQRRSRAVGGRIGRAAAIVGAGIAWWLVSVALVTLALVDKMDEETSSSAEAWWVGIAVICPVVGTLALFGLLLPADRRPRRIMLPIAFGAGVIWLVSLVGVLSL
jgi:hypothetical protein